MLSTVGLVILAVLALVAMIRSKNVDPKYGAVIICAAVQVFWPLRLADVVGVEEYPPLCAHCESLRRTGVRSAAFAYFEDCGDAEGSDDVERDGAPLLPEPSICRHLVSGGNADVSCRS